MTTTSDTPHLDKVTRTYIRIRDAKSELKKKYDQEVQQLDEQLDVLKRVLLEHCKEHGVDSVRTGSGLFYRSVKTRYWTSDWAAMHAFILENELPEFLEKRLNQTEVRNYLEEHPENPLPALNVDSEFTLSVRKK